MTRQSDPPLLPERRIRKPIIVIGCARSATTMMGRILTRHPDVAFWHEPRPIWMYGNAYRSHYELTADDLTPRIAEYIDRKFGRFLERSGKRRFGEKTPSNCFRIPFIHALYPDCRIVNIIRDGRHVARSIMQMEQKTPIKGKLSKRLKQTPIWEWPAYIPMFFRTFVRTRVLGKTTRYWGPKPKGWQAWQALPRHQMVAEQWRTTVEASIRAGRALPGENYHEIRYEALMQQPVEVLKEMMDFVELPPAEEMLDFAASHIDPNRTYKWKGTLSEEQERDIEARMRPMLIELGYMSEASGGSGSSGDAVEHVNQ